MTIFMPERIFVGGSTESFSHTLTADLTGYTATFTLTEAIRIRTASPVVSKTASITVIPSTKIKSTVSATINESDTQSLNGRYVYQIVAKKSGAQTYVFQGLCAIVTNNAQN